MDDPVTEASYTAWDGQHYPWPPPEGWYLAADGRWWHPDSGPGGVSPRAPEQGVRAQPDPTGRAALSAGRPSKGWRRWWPLVIGLPLAAVGAGLVAIVLFRDPAPEPLGSEVADGTASTQLPVTTLDTESTTISTATESSASTVLQPDRSPDELVADFRALLEENDLTSGSLTDEEIVTFGSTLCVFAASAEEPEDFDALRELAIADTESELSDVELTLAISAAIVVFCPLEAERLGIAL